MSPGRGGPPLAPPRLATRFLEWALPPTAVHESILGDLHEEFLRRSVDRPTLARVWYVREAVGLTVRYARRGRRYRRPKPVRDPRSEVATLTLETRVYHVASNLRYAVRRLRRAPFFSLIAIASLGIGIGANTAMFSLVNAAMLRDLPFHDPEGLVDIYERSEGFSHGTLSYPDYIDFVEGSSDVFEAVGGMQVGLVQGDSDSGTESWFAEAVTGNYFGIVGVQAALGRMISEEDHVDRGAHPVVVLSHDHWTSRYAADRSMIGREIRLSGRPYTVVGVAPKEYPGSIRGLEPAVFVPIMMLDELQGSSRNNLEARGNQSFFGKARLRDGVEWVQAEAVAERISNRLRADYPDYWEPEQAFVLERTEDVIMNPMLDRFILPVAAMIMTVVGLVLLIACANLASFLLARAADRRKEVAVRLALGAKRRTLVAQLLTETVLLSAIGGVAGVVLAARSLDLLTRADLPLALPITLDLSLDTTVLAFSVAVSVLAGLLFGLIPALQSTTPDVATTLRDESSGGGRGKSARLRDLLVVAQVAVSVVLLAGAGLFLRSLDASRSIDPGFGLGPTGIVQLTLPADRYEDEQVEAFVDELRARIGARPGVQGVGIVDNIPLNQLSTQYARVRVDGVDPPPGRDFHMVDHAVVDEGFFGAMGIGVLEGRGVEAGDRSDSEKVAWVNTEFARIFLADGDAVGRTITVGDDAWRVAGVIRTHKVRRIGEDPRPFLYRSFRQVPTNYAFVVAHTTMDDERLLLDMISDARALDPNVMLTQTLTLRRHLASMLLGRELGAAVVGGFALLALLLASIGLYGVVSYAVSRRAKEVGIRRSLGADDATVIRMLTRDGMRLVVVGGVVGLLAAAALAGTLSRLLYGIRALDPVTFLAVPAVLLVVAFFASWIPARRAARMDPVGALRAE